MIDGKICLCVRVRTGDELVSASMNNVPWVYIDVSRDDLLDCLGSDDLYNVFCHSDDRDKDNGTISGRFERVVIGSENGFADKDTVGTIVRMCHASGTPVFMTESIREAMGDEFIQEMV